jgi:hypothetical protein
MPGISGENAELEEITTVDAGRRAAKSIVVRLFLLPIDVVAKLGLETFYVKAKHAVHAQLAQFSGISRPESYFFFFGEIVFLHYGFEIR